MEDITVNAYQLGWLLGLLQGQTDKAAGTVETSFRVLSSTASKQLFDLGGCDDVAVREDYFEGYGAGYETGSRSPLPY